MTEQSFVWEVGGGGDESPHSVTQWGAVEAAIAGVASANEGVLPRVLNELAPSTQAGATQIRIASGWAIVDGHPYHNDGNEDFTPVTPAVGTTGRRAVLRADWSAQTVRVVEISSADGTATIPGLTQTSGTTYEIPLCQYTVTTGGAIGAFVDEREFCGAAPEVIIARRVLGTTAAAVSFADLPPFFRAFELTVMALGSTTATFWIRLNNDSTGTNYSIQTASRSHSTAGGARATAGQWTLGTDLITGSVWGSFSALIQKSVVGAGAHLIAQANGVGTITIQLWDSVGFWENTTDLINRIDVLASTGTFAAGSVFTLRGLR